MQQSLGNMFVWQEAVVVSFTSNRPFYRYGGHIEFISFKEYYGMPKGHSLSIYPRRELHCLFLGKKAITITSKHRTTIFFPITIGTLRSNDAHGKENVKKQ